MRNRVKIVCSLPYFSAQGCDHQRGPGVFERVIQQLRDLNERGYGKDPFLRIDLVYNVDGPFLPPDQRELQDFYAHQLRSTQNVVFNGLYAFNNYALGRFAHRLDRAGKLDYYLSMLAENYNAAVVSRMMCRNQVNVDWDGCLYDCECNHVLGIPILGDDGGPLRIADIVDNPLKKRTIRTNPICYSCAAGCGSSCGGSLIDKVSFDNYDYH